MIPVLKKQEPLNKNPKTQFFETIKPLTLGQSFIRENLCPADGKNNNNKNRKVNPESKIESQNSKKSKKTK